MIRWSPLTKLHFSPSLPLTSHPTFPSPPDPPGEPVRHAGGGTVSKEHVRFPSPVGVPTQSGTGRPLAALPGGTPGLQRRPPRGVTWQPWALPGWRRWRGIHPPSSGWCLGPGPSTTPYKVETSPGRRMPTGGTLRWSPAQARALRLSAGGQTAFRRFQVVPPGTGIVHQVNIEYLASVVPAERRGGAGVPLPGHHGGNRLPTTTMVNGLACGGLGRGGNRGPRRSCWDSPDYLPSSPRVVGVSSGPPPGGAHPPTDLVAPGHRDAREHGVVGALRGKFFARPLGASPLADRATIATGPEYGATIGFFPVDESAGVPPGNRNGDEGLVRRVEEVARAQGLFPDGRTPRPELTPTRLKFGVGEHRAQCGRPPAPPDRISLRSQPLLRSGP